MVTRLFLSIPTSDLDRSKVFFEAIGWRVNPLFTDENAACIVIDENLFLMVLTREFMATFTDKPIVDPKTAAQIQVAFSRDSREDVDTVLDQALAAGGTEQGPAQDYGFMYSRDFEDPDGNVFSALWMDPVAAEIGPNAYAAQQDTDA